MKIENIYPVSTTFEELQSRIDTALEVSEGEITPEINAMLGELARAEWAIDLANYVNRLEAETRAVEARVKPIIEALEADLATVKRKLERGKEWLVRAVPPGTELVNDQMAVWYRQTTVADVLDAEAIPLEFSRVKTEPDKRAILAALKEGKEVPGATLKISYSIQIEHPGEKAKANAKARAKRKAAQTVDLSTALEG